MIETPKSKLAWMSFMLDRNEWPPALVELIASEFIEFIENNIEVWDEDTGGGIAFFAAAGDQWRDTSLNVRSKAVTLREIIYQNFIFDDDSGWEKAEKLGMELKALSDELLSSAERGRATVDRG